MIHLFFTRSPSPEGLATGDKLKKRYYRTSTIAFTLITPSDSSRAK